MARGSVVNNEGDCNISCINMGPRSGVKAYVEHGRILKRFAVGGHPLVPCDRLTPFGDVFSIAIEPTLRRRTGKLSERRFGVTDLVFDEGEDEDEDRGRDKP